MLGGSGSRAAGCVFVVTCIIAPLCAAEGEPDSSASKRPEDLPSVVAGDIRSAVRLALRTYSAPFHWDGRDWLMAGGGCVMSGASAFVDAGARNMLARNHSVAADRISDAGIAYGDGLNVALATAGLYGIGLVTRETWLRETMMLAGTATLVSASISTVTKFVVGRARPYTELGNHYFKPFDASEDYISFPSGHTVVAFSVSSVLAERIGNPWATVGLYGLAAATGIGRMYRDDHWLSDVVPAALYSAFIGRSIVRWYEQMDTNATSSLEVVPGVSSLTLVWRFPVRANR